MIRTVLFAAALCLFARGAFAAELSPEAMAKADAASLAAFEQLAADAQAAGAGFLSVTDGIPPSLWQFDPPDDPYPAWFVYRPSIMKIFPPKELAPYVNAPYAARVSKILAQRCEILRKHGLKGQWSSNEPQVLPEAFFQAYPRLRGPRVDQPNRSRIARFSPSADQPEVLRLYREALTTMWKSCPEIVAFDFLTQDSGSGFDWAPSLYPGINGNSEYKDRPLVERVAGFLENFQDAAKPLNLDITVNINPISPRDWMVPTFTSTQLDALYKLLPPGCAVGGRQGPDGSPMPRAQTFVGDGGDGRRNGVFYPVIGIPTGGRGGGRGGRGGRGGGNAIDRATAERAAAVAEVGEENADDLMALHASLAEAGTHLNDLDFGGMLRFGMVLGRWIDRPLVPFPGELKPAEKDFYRPYLFQARTEEDADNLVDIQGMLMYQGWGAHLLFQRVIDLTLPQMQSALRSAQRIASRMQDPKAKHEWDLNGKRIEVAIHLLHTADNVVAYQAHLDRAKALELKPEKDPPLGLQPDWARTDMMETARNEIDNMAQLLDLLKSSDEPLIDMAPTPEEEYVMRLGPNLADQIKKKIDVMNAHWKDYDRIFSVPNP